MGYPSMTLTQFIQNTQSKIKAYFFFGFSSQNHNKDFNTEKEFLPHCKTKTYFSTGGRRDIFELKITFQLPSAWPYINKINLAKK